MYSVINQLLDNNQDVTLPDSKSDEDLANGLMQYFMEKIDNLRAKFNSEINYSSLVVPGQVNQKLSKFEEATTDDLLQIVH